MKSFIRVTTLLVLILGMASVAEAGGRHGKFKEEIFKQLDLTADQTAKLETLKANKSEIKKMRTEKKEIRKKFKEALARDASESELRDLHNKKFSIRKQMADARFDKMLAVRKVLTPEQRMKFQKLMKEHKKSGRGKGRRFGK